MSDTKAPSGQPESPELSNFMKLARALFRVDKRDVPKHEPKKRQRDVVDGGGGIHSSGLDIPGK